MFTRRNITNDTLAYVRASWKVKCNLLELHEGIHRLVQVHTMRRTLLTSVTHCPSSNICCLASWQTSELHDGHFASNDCLDGCLRADIRCDALSMLESPVTICQARDPLGSPAPRI